MKNIPMFTTVNGVASLTLEEIPYKKSAYIRIQDVQDPGKLLQEAVDFCKAVGADQIFATGDDCLRCYPLHTEIWEMSCHAFDPTNENAVLVSVDESNISNWQALYNRHMADVPNAATMTNADRKKLLDENDGYFVYEEGTCIGIGKAKDDRIHGIVSLIPGKGRVVLNALCGALTVDVIKVEVASANERAVRLYHKCGFEKTGVLSKWYKVF